MQVQQTNSRNTQIAQIAYQLWEEEGRPAGKDRDHWLRAEVLFNQRQKSAPTQAAKPVNQPAVQAPPQEAGKNGKGRSRVLTTK